VATETIGSVAPEVAIVTSQYPLGAASRDSAGLVEMIGGTTDWTTGWRQHLIAHNASAVLSAGGLLSGVAANLLSQSRLVTPIPKCNLLAMRFLQRTNDGTWHTGDGLTPKTSKVYIHGVEEMTGPVTEYILDPLLALTVKVGNKRTVTTSGGAQANQSRVLPDSTTTANRVFWGADITIDLDYTRATAVVRQAMNEFGRAMVEFDAQGYCSLLLTFVNTSGVVATGAMLRGY